MSLLEAIKLQRNNRLLLLLLATSERVFNIHLVGFQLHVTKQERKLALKGTRYYVSPENQGGARCGNTLQ